MLPLYKQVLKFEKIHFNNTKKNKNNEQNKLKPKRILPNQTRMVRVIRLYSNSGQPESIPGHTV